MKKSFNFSCSFGFRIVLSTSNVIEGIAANTMFKHPNKKIRFLIRKFNGGIHGVKQLPSLEMDTATRVQILPSQLGLWNTLTAFLQRNKTPPPTNECLGYDTIQSDGDVPVMLKLWRMQSTPSLPLLPGPLWPSVGQIELNCILIQDIENVLILNRIV